MRSPSLPLSKCVVPRSSISRRICSIRIWMPTGLPWPSMIVVVSLSTTTRRARPRCASWTLWRLSPRSAAIGMPPVSSARSSSTRERRSPNSGATTATVLIDAAQVVADQRPHRLALDHVGDDQQRVAGRRDQVEDRHEVHREVDLAVDEQDVRVVEHGLGPARRPSPCRPRRSRESSRAPSLTSSSRCIVWPSWIESRPSLPTASIASAISAPIAGSPEEIAATRAICSRSVSCTACTSRRCATTCATASSMPRRSAQRVRAGGDVAQPVAHQRLREHRRRRRAVAGDLVGRRRDLAHEPRPRALERPRRDRSRRRSSRRRW